jgi:hypothetical protein
MISRAFRTQTGSNYIELNKADVNHWLSQNLSKGHKVKKSKGHNGKNRADLSTL